jgi:hypothetical protein
MRWLAGIVACLDTRYGAYFYFRDTYFGGVSFLSLWTMIRDMQTSAPAIAMCVEQLVSDYEGTNG